MIEQYSSVYGKHIESFIDLKRKLGFKYVEGAINLYKIDGLAIKSGETSAGITPVFARQWTEKRSHESARFHRKRVAYLVQFSSYLCGLGIKSYIPKMPLFIKSNTFVPYIYSPKEMNALFDAADALRMSSQNMTSCLISFPTLIRML